jgi:hypothetical protein
VLAGAGLLLCPRLLTAVGTDRVPRPRLIAGVISGGLLRSARLAPVSVLLGGALSNGVVRGCRQLRID